jgi:hypothetical protein
MPVVLVVDQTVQLVQHLTQRPVLVAVQVQEVAVESIHTVVVV